MTSAAKLEKLRVILREMGGAVLAYSGGVDSAFLLKVAVETLGNRVHAVTAVSATYSLEEFEQAKALAASLGARHSSIVTDELENADFIANTPNRCYHCKKTLFARLREIAQREGITTVIDASNADDLDDFRPGRKAGQEAGVRSPLAEVGLTKAEIRQLSKEMGLATWDKPSAACLASRLPYGEAITVEKLNRISQAEKLLTAMGFRQVRVRSHGDLARIEVEPERIGELAEPALRARVAAEMKKLGFTYVALDLQGYRMGSLNEALPSDTSGP